MRLNITGVRSSVSAAAGLASNAVHKGRPPLLLLTIFGSAGVGGGLSLSRDHLPYCDLATDRQRHYVSTIYFANIMPFPPTRCIRSPNSSLAGRGCTTRVSSLSRTWRLGRTPNHSRDHLLAGLMQYVRAQEPLHKFTSGHKFVCDRDGTIAATYETHWAGLSLAPAGNEKTASRSL